MSKTSFYELHPVAKILMASIKAQINQILAGDAYTGLLCLCMNKKETPIKTITVAI
jgi:hypothetical protein